MKVILIDNFDDNQCSLSKIIIRPVIISVILCTIVVLGLDLASFAEYFEFVLVTTIFYGVVWLFFRNIDKDLDENVARKLHELCLACKKANAVVENGRLKVVFDNSEEVILGMFDVSASDFSEINEIKLIFDNNKVKMEV